MNVYDRMAPEFDRRRALPDGVPDTIRAAVLQAAAAERPRILDLGAGAGRIGRSLVRANDNYTGVDLSIGMLQAFAGTARDPSPQLAQADGSRLPFADAIFDAVMLIQVLSGAHGWRHLLADAMRVTRPSGALIVGRVVAPDDGVDARMKSRLEAILDDLNIYPYRDKPREDALSWLSRQMPNPATLTVATWMADRSAGAFIERHGSGARFSVLEQAVKQDAMHRLAVWAIDRFGSLDTTFAESHRFELIIHRFQQGTPV